MRTLSPDELDQVRSVGPWQNRDALRLVKQAESIERHARYRRAFRFARDVFLVGVFAVAFLAFCAGLDLR